MKKRRTLLRALAVAGAVILVGAGTAYALRIQLGKLVVVANGGFSPTALPKNEDAPIRLQGFAKFSTTDGSLPPVLTKLVIEYDRHGHVETRGLPVCTPGKLAATTTKQAHKLCPGSIVGTGFGKAVVAFPDQRPIPVSSPITIFNGRPKGGNPTVLAHAHVTYPGPTTYVVPIQKINKGRYGFRTEAEIPRIAGGYGTPTFGRIVVGRTWKHKGKTLSYANARCADGRLQARGQFFFRDGTLAEGTVFRPCTVRK